MAPDIDGQYVRAQLPERFHDLVALMQKWCIADDSLRLEAMDNAAIEELKELIDRVEPRLHEIGAYCDSVRKSLFGEERSLDKYLAVLKARREPASLEQVVTLLDALAVCAIEARDRLAFREATKHFPE